MPPLTPEEEQIIMAMIEQGQIPVDPMTAATNMFGQGSDYLNLEDTPTSWDRMGDMDDLLGDTLKRAGIYFEDLVDLPYQEYEDPGEYAGWEDYTSPVYGANPAYQLVVEAMNDPEQPMSFDEAFNKVVQAAAADETLRAALPQNEDGELDVDSFRSGAIGAVEDSTRANTERAAYDDQQAAYEDYVRSRTGLDINPIVESKRLAEGFEPGVVAGNQPTGAPLQVDAATLRSNSQPRVTGGYGGSQAGVLSNVANITPDVAAGGLGGLAGSPYEQNARGRGGLNQLGRIGDLAARVTSPDRNVDRSQFARNPRGELRSAPTRQVQRDSKGRTGSDVSFDRNKNMNQGYEMARAATSKARQSQQVMSKQDANRAAILQQLAQVMYGGNA